MKAKDIPQDPGALDKFTKEICYAVNESGEYVTKLSRGWEIKADALDVAWDDIAKRVEAARNKVKAGEVSPLLYYMELKLMDIDIVAAYTGIWKWRVKRHLKPKLFDKLSKKVLEKYANIFEVSVEDLKTLGDGK
jgi:hypothetical protein